MALHVGQEIIALFPKCFLERLQEPPKLPQVACLPISASARNEVGGWLMMATPVPP